MQVQMSKKEQPSSVTPGLIKAIVRPGKVYGARRRDGSPQYKGGDIVEVTESELKQAHQILVSADDQQKHKAVLEKQKTDRQSAYEKMREAQVQSSRDALLAAVSAQKAKQEFLDKQTAFIQGVKAKAEKKE